MVPETCVAAAPVKATSRMTSFALLLQQRVRTEPIEAEVANITRTSLLMITDLPEPAIPERRRWPWRRGRENRDRILKMMEVERAGRGMEGRWH